MLDGACAGAESSDTGHRTPHARNELFMWIIEAKKVKNWIAHEAGGSDVADATEGTEML